MTAEELEDFLAENEYVAGKVVGSTVVAVCPMTFGNYRLLVNCDAYGYEHGY